MESTRRSLRKVVLASSATLALLVALTSVSREASSGATLADEPPTASENYSALVDDLGSADFAVRESAETALTAAATEAEAALRSGADDDDLEIRTRARRLLREVEQARLQETPPGWELSWSLPRKALPNFYNLDPWTASGVLLAEDDRRLKAFDVRSGKPLWDAPVATPLGNAVPAVQAAAEGFVCFTQNHLFEFFDAQTGEKRWTTDLKFTPQQWFVRGDLIVAGDNRRLVAVSTVDGEFVYQIESPKQYAPLGGDGERLVLWSNSERKIAIRRIADATPVAEWSPAQPPNGVVALHGDRIVFLDASRQYVSAHRLSDGLALWTSPLELAHTPHQTYFWTWFDANETYLAGPGLLWSLESGQKLLDRKPPGPRVESLRLVDQLAGPIRAFPVPPTVAEDVVYYPGLNGQIVALNIADRSVRWTWQIGAGQGYRVVLLGDRMIASTDRRIVCLTRRPESHPQSAPQTGPPVIVAEKPERERP
ncbi:MAG TPA: PQQ-binding-like beta-propeller repeat protein [Pirellulales bacterium]